MLCTNPYPAFPTDMQSQMMVVLTQCQGLSVICETVFESRFRIVNDLVRMGANIEIKGNYAYIEGNTPLYGKEVEATDLRGGAALVLAGLLAKGTTIISDDKYIKRGYEDIVRDLKALGANISYINE